MSSRLLITITVLLLFAMLLLPFAANIIAAHAESRAYNRLTGAHTTWWDAMFVELRVTAPPLNLNPTKP